MITSPAAPDALNAMINAHSLILANDDQLFPIDRLDLILLISDQFTNINAMNAFLLAYDICPMHRCDIQICRDDNETKCAELR